MNKKVIALLGAGSWGTAVAQLLAKNGYTVNLWCYEPEVASDIAQTHENKKYLPGIKLHKNIITTTDLPQAVCKAQWVFEAIPVAHLRTVLEHARDCANADQIWVVLSKGIENNTCMFPMHIIDDLFQLPIKTAVVAGPSFAHEVAKEAFTGVTIGAIDEAVGIELQQMLNNEYLKACVTKDVMGVQVGAALKNVMSIGIGLLDGAGYGDNPKALLLTRGLQEMVHFAQVLGGKQETIYGLSGVGDLVLTSMGASSKNREVGRRIGHGEKLSAIIEQTGYVVEGVNTLKSVVSLAQKHQVNVPICSGISDVVFGNASVEDMMREILDLPIK